jgi:HlyD family secretion protein
MNAEKTMDDAHARDLITGPLPRRFRRLLLWGLVVLLGVGATTAWALIRKKNGSADTRYRTEAVERGALIVTITATGNLQPTNQVDVGTEISGTIKSAAAIENDQVRVGQVLAELDNTKLQAQAMQAEAVLAAARARVLQSQATVAEARNQVARLDLVRDLSSGQAASQLDLDAAQAVLSRAQADTSANHAAVQQAEAALTLVRTDLAKAVIRSPINGIVLLRSAEPGQTVAASLQAPVLFNLAEDLTRMELHVAVDEADVGLVKPGQPAEFSVDAFPGRRFLAEITQVNFGSQTTEGVVTYKTVLKVDNADMHLRPGMTATAEITVNRIADVLLVPNAALRFSPPLQEKSSSRGDGVIGLLLPRGPRPRPAGSEQPNRPGDGRRQRVWVLRNGIPTPIVVATGASDGARTEVTEAELTAGTPLIVDFQRGRP